jgi:putative ABC transport system permease protein
MWRDLIHCLRVIRRYPFSSAAIVLVLALGIGANTAMFAIFRTWILKPLDFVDSERLVAPYAAHRDQPQIDYNVSARDAADWRETRGLAGLSLFVRHSFRVDDETDPERVEGARIEASLFPLLGVEPVLGRGFDADEDRPGHPGAVALLSDDLWRRRFAADPAVIDREIRLDGRPYRIVGVMKPGFAFPEWGDVWVPLGVDAEREPRDRRAYDVVARLAPDVSRGQAGAELRAVADRLAQLHPETNRDWIAVIQPLRGKWLPPGVRIALLVSLSAALFVLLIICSNVAGLLLAQANARSREMALRAALGAARSRLVRQTVTECTVLAAAGGVLGVPAAMLLNGWMATWSPTRPPYLFTIQVDAHAIGFAALVTLVAGFACGLAPVARNVSMAVWETLAAGMRVGAGPNRQRLGALLVIGELALSTALGIGTVLLAKSFLAQRLADHGYRVEGVAALELDLDTLGYQGAAERVTFVARAQERVAALPEIAAVGIASRLPAGQQYFAAKLEVEGVTVETGREPLAAAHWVTPGYFEALDIRPLDGRVFTAGETHDGAAVAMVSTTLAGRLWPGPSPVGEGGPGPSPVGEGGPGPSPVGEGGPGASPIGRRLRLLDGDGTWLRVIGVVRDVEPIATMIETGRPARLDVYLPWSLAPTSRPRLVIHAVGPLEPAVDRVRAAVRAVDRAVPVMEVLTMTDALDREWFVGRTFSQLLGFYASVAVAMALVGVYGLAADAASGRTRELAIRLALGARRGQVVGLVMRQGVILGAAGIAVGLLLAFALTRFSAAMLAGISAQDPAVFGGVAVLVAAVTLIAIWLPARGATRVEPAKALRAE